MPAVYLVPVVLGVALLALAALVWSGAWRAGHNVVGVPVLITIVPGTAPLLIVFGVTPYVPTAAGAVLVMLALLVALASWVLMTIRPQWYGPRWWREYRLLDVPEPAPEPAVAAHNSEHLARAARRPAKPQARRAVTLLAPAGPVTGHLLLYPDELVFVADRAADVARSAPTVETLAAADVTATADDEAIRIAHWRLTAARPDPTIADLERVYGRRVTTSDPA